METSRSYNDHLPADWQNINDEDPREELYNQYGNLVFEDFESFCNRMANKYGENWVNILSR